MTATLISGALQTPTMLGGQKIPIEQLPSHPELARIGVGTAITDDALIGML